ncbi:MAG: hypothetical protein AMJ64_06125 [Betaproteobacteria bacterium SG8_39]|nr:MAG: hypothetical protein AMJ64_06125 [Betaproteobacteria bacterium SG8_39]
MATKRLIYFSAAELRVYRRTRSALASEARFSADEAGIEAFRGFLGRHRGALFYVVADLAGEDFHEDQIPFLRGAERRTVIERRLAQRYRDTRLAAAISLGVVKDERRNERLLLASFTNAQQFTPWLDALAEAGTKLAGVFSVPMLAPALAARLAGRQARCLVVSVDRAGLRQSFIDNGRLRFARLEPTVNLAPDALALFVRSETARLAQYLGTLRVLPRDGTPLKVLVVAPRGERARFEQALLSDAHLEFVTTELPEAQGRVGLRSAPQDSFAETLYLHLAARIPPKEQFAKREERRGYLLWQLQRAVAAAGIAGLAACALYAGVIWVDILSVRGQIDIQQRESRNAADRYASITRTFPVTQTTTDNLKATVNEFRKIAARSASPEGTLAHLSAVLEQFPEFELDNLTWQIGKTDAPESRANAAATRAKPAATVDQSVELLEINGRVNAAQRSDYREITEKVERFAEALGSNPAYRVVRTRLPFDVASEGTLTGDVGAQETGEAPRFTIVLAKRLP